MLTSSSTAQAKKSGINGSLIMGIKKFLANVGMTSMSQYEGLTAKERYDAIFEKEKSNVYHEISEYENECGAGVSLTRLEEAARVLACPLKVNPPSWQHGRVIYATVRRLLKDGDSSGTFVDIGTAKGFSAVVMGWAVEDAGAKSRVASVDIVDPGARLARNSVLEADGELHSVYDFVRPFKGNLPIEFFGGGSDKFLRTLSQAHERVRFAFVDGKHSYESVTNDVKLLSQMQSKGDVLIFDDIQIDGVMTAVARQTAYDFRSLSAGPMRRYAIAVRR